MRARDVAAAAIGVVVAAVVLATLLLIKAMI